MIEDKTDGKRPPIRTEGSERRSLKSWEAAEGAPRFLESALDNANDAVLLTEADPLDGPGPRIVYANEAFTRMTGYSRGEISGATPRLLQGPETDREELGEIRAALEDGCPVKKELLNYRKDGTKFWVELDIVPVEDEGGWPRYWLSVQRDTTGRVRAEEERRESERHLRAVLTQYGSEMISILEPDGAPRYESLAIAQSLGCDHREIAGGRWRHSVHPEDNEKLSEAVAGFLERAGEHPPVEFRVRRADGSWRYFESIGNNLVHDPEVGGIVVRTHDITARKQAEEDLKQSEQRLRTVTGGAPVILFSLDREGRITLSEGKALESLGRRPGEDVGCSVFEAFQDLPQVLANVRCALDGEEVAATLELAGLAFETRYSPQRDEDGEIAGVIGVATDVTDRRELEKELEHRAFHDPLTDLPNRSLFMDRLSQALTRAERWRESPVVLFVDLDGFKAINDSFGHEEGDELLTVVAGRLLECLRSGDTVSRFGGDEFAILLEGSSPEDAVAVAERISERVAQPLTLTGGGEVSITASTGIACSATTEEQSASQMLRNADLSMYRAKTADKVTNRHH